MPDLWEQLLGIAKPLGAVPALLSIFCVFLMFLLQRQSVQLERERKHHEKDHADMLAILDRTLAKLR